MGSWVPHVESYVDILAISSYAEAYKLAALNIAMEGDNAFIF